MRKIKLCTHIDRKPNYLFDFWIKHHLRFFGKNDFLFASDTKLDAGYVVDYLRNNYDIEVDILNDIKHDTDVSKSILLINEKESPQDYKTFTDYARDYHNWIQHRLLDEGINVVVWMDIDELIYHNDLGNVLQEFEGDVIRPRGVEIIHDLENEADFDFSKKIKEQRSKIRYYGSKNKPTITRAKIGWDAGKHQAGGYPHGDNIELDKLYDGLYLIHLHYLDLKSMQDIYRENLTIYNECKRQHNQSGPEFLEKRFAEVQSDILDGDEIIGKLDI